MCGIAGVLGIETGRAVRAADSMLRALRHRGPDHAAVAVVPVAPSLGPPPVLVHARLKILDLSPSGDQPMTDGAPGAAGDGAGVAGAFALADSPSLHITYNGEIYNHADLRRDLEGRGFAFRSRSDTEVILKAYRQWGEAAVERLQGMFAFCLVDAGCGLAWLCRDPVGIKPLYVCRPPGGGLLFASEVRTLLAAGPDLVTRRIDRASLESFLAQGAVMGEDSIVEGVTLVPPGESLVVDLAGTRLRSGAHWRLPRPAPAGDSAAAAAPGARGRLVAALGVELERSVRGCLAADVPVSLFLSGGIDSTALALVTARCNRAARCNHAARRKTGAADNTSAPTLLTIGFDEADFDESGEARRTAARLGLAHDVLRLDDALVAASIEAVFHSMDQPTVDGFNTFHISKLARERGFKVALTGLGGDELFGGYATFRDVPLAFRAARAARAVKPVAWGGRLAASLIPGRGGPKARALLRRPADIAQVYLLRRELFLPDERRLLHPLPGGCDPHGALRTAHLSRIADDVAGMDPLDAVARLEFGLFMQQMLLRDADVFSMAHGLELRVPLLDQAVVAAALSAPAAWRRNDGRNKPLLIDAAAPGFPEDTARRPKRGFTFPWDRWLRRTRAEQIETVLRDPLPWRLLGFAPAVPAALYDAFVQGDARVPALHVMALAAVADYAVRHELSV